MTGQLLVAALATLLVVFGVSAASKAGSTRQRAFAKSFAGAAGVVVAIMLIRVDEIVELFAPTGLAGRMQERS